MPSDKTGPEEESGATVSSERHVRHLVMRRAVSIEQAMRAAGQEDNTEMVGAHLRMARSLAHDILKVLDAHIGALQDWQMRDMDTVAAPLSKPERVAPLARAGPLPPNPPPEEVPAPQATPPNVATECATCQHWYPDGVRDLAESGSCRKPSFVTQVHHKGRPWPSVGRTDACRDWCVAPGIAAA